MDTVAVHCEGQLVAWHQRCWAKQAVITDPAHKQTAAVLRHEFTEQRRKRAAATRYHADGHAVTMRALPDYDALFGVDFNPSTEASNQ